MKKIILSLLISASLFSFSQTPQSRNTLTTTPYGWGMRVVPVIAPLRDTWASFHNIIDDGAAATATNAIAFTNKTGNISQWTNDVPYATTLTLSGYEPKLNGTGFVKSTGTVTSYVTEVGTGSVVLNTSPTFTTNIFVPMVNSGTAAGGTLNLRSGTGFNRGYTTFGLASSANGMIFDEVTPRLGIAFNGTPVSRLHLGAGTNSIAAIQLTSQTAVSSPSAGSIWYDTGFNFTGSTTATAYIKSGGLSTEFLKADGSVDNNTYLTGSTGWSILGNTGTTAGTNFLGTTDAQDLVFKTNSTERFRIDAIGNATLSSSISGGLGLTVKNTSTTGYSTIGTLSDDGNSYASIGTFNTAGGVGSMYDANTSWISLGSTVATGIINEKVGPIIFATNTFGTSGEAMRVGSNKNVSISGASPTKISTPTAILHIGAGTSIFAPIRTTTAAILTGTNILVGNHEFVNDKVYYTIPTGTVQKEFTMNDAALTPSNVAYAEANGRLTGDNAFNYNTTTGLSTSSLNVAGTFSVGGLTATRVPFMGAGGKFLDASTFTFGAITGILAMPEFSTSSTATITSDLNVGGNAQITGSANVTTTLQAATVVITTIGNNRIPYASGGTGRLTDNSGLTFTSGAGLSTTTITATGNVNVTNTVTAKQVTISGLATGAYALDISGTSTPLNISSANSNSLKVALSDAGTVRGYIGCTTGEAFNVWDNAASAKRFIVASSGLVTMSGSLTVAGTTTLNSGFSLPVSVGASMVGNATLVGGTVTVTTSKVLTGSYVILTRKTAGGVIGNETYTINNGVSFTINSDNALDTSTFSWFIINP